MVDEFNVAAKLKVMPTGVDVDLDKIKGELGKAVSEYGKLHSAEIKPIAFGLSAIEATVLMVDDSGGLDQLEEKIKDIEGVSEVELLEVTRL